MGKVGRNAGWLAAVVVVAAVAVWNWHDAPSAAPNEPVGGGRPAMGQASHVTAASVPPRPVYPGGVVAVDPASLTQAERRALADREVEASAAAPPAASFKGIDGKMHAFHYPDAAQSAAAERTRQARHEQLMQELAADPARFARAHQLSLDEVRLIVDGEADFPDRLLEP